MSMPTDVSSPARKPRQKAFPAARKGDDKIKATIVLPRDLDFRLTVLAAHRGIDRSTLVAEILSPHLRGVVVSLRGQAGDEPGTVAIGETLAA